MKLSEEDAKLFFKLMLPLLFYTSRKLELLPEVSTFEEFEKVTFEDKSVIRDELYENVHLIDSFIDENPQDLPMKELAIISKWKNFVRGDFYIERYLKNHAIFISDDNKVFAVRSLRDSFEKLIPKYALPLRVQTVLLPFLNEIVYDGFLASYRVFFGNGVKNNLKHIYLKAKKRETIIFSLDLDAEPKQAKKPAKPFKDWKPEIKELAEQASKLRGGAGQSELLSPAFSLVKASLELTDLAADKKPDRDAIFKTIDKIDRHFKKFQEELYYLED